MLGIDGMGAGGGYLLTGYNCTFTIAGATYRDLWDDNANFLGTQIKVKGKWHTA